MGHDQLFKELLQEFFAEFLTLFFPAEVAQLDLGSVTFPGGEEFTDFPDGSLRRADLIAEVRTRGGDVGILLFHFEVQRKRGGEMPARMWEYYALLRLRRRRPVVPVVIYLAPGAGGIVAERYTESVFGRTFLTFEYIAVGLQDLTAADYEAETNPLAAALSVLMRSPNSDRVARKLRALTRVAAAPLNEARKLLLATVVDRYLPLSPDEAEIFTERLQATTQGAKEVMSIYDIIREDAREEGIWQGWREALLRQMRQKFGRVPEDVERQVKALDSEESLTALGERILTANSLAELRLDEIAAS